MDIKTQIQQAREKAKKLYPEGRAQAKRFTPEIYIPLCEQAAFIEGAEWLLSEIGKENEGLKELVKLQDDYISFLSNESNKYVQFAGLHGMRVPTDVYEQGQKHRNDIGNKKIQLSAQPLATIK